MLSRKLTFGFDFCSCSHLHNAVTQLSTKFIGTILTVHDLPNGTILMTLNDRNPVFKVTPLTLNISIDFD